jgi:kinesin family protein 15
MSLNEKQLDALGKQHKEMLDIYAKKISALQLVESKVTENIKNMNKVIDDHVQKEKDILNSKIAETEKLKLESITMKKDAQNLLYEAQQKMEEANKIHLSTTQSQELHKSVVKTHIDNVSNINSDLAKRHGECAAREEQLNDVLIGIKKKLEESMLEQKKVELECDKLRNMEKTIKDDIEVQKDLYFKNKQILDDIKSIKTEVDAIKNKSDSDMAEVIRMRDDLDRAQARIEKTSQEIIKRNDECKAREIQIKVTEQALKNRKSNLDGQEGRLNELRNNVNSLLEKQQATVPQQGE